MRERPTDWRAEQVSAESRVACPTLSCVVFLSGSPFRLRRADLFASASLSLPSTHEQKAKPTAATSGESRTARIPRNELLDLLFTHFEQAPYWSIKALTEHVRQPQVYLKEVLGDIAMLVPRGPYQGMWTLREEYKGGKGGPAGKKEEGGDQKPNVGHGADEDDDEDDMEVVS